MPTNEAALADPLAAQVPETGKPAPRATRFVCVHGHFYQPPRENPWLETVELQESAAPFHDWNERITAECYAPNGASRIQNKAGEITRILNNYGLMSFNFGPTLLSWLETYATRTYRSILEADAQSAARFSGHGSAVAQVYNHIIMPLASERDARTQIRWGIADFKSRFGRMPEGMWLAETAASRAVLDLLAQEGIKFTILAPHQCARMRRMPAEEVAARANATAAAREAAEQDLQHPKRTRRATDQREIFASRAAMQEPPAMADANRSAMLEAGLPMASSGVAGQGNGSGLRGSLEAAEAALGAAPETMAKIAEPTAAKKERTWIETPDAAVDPHHPYLVKLDEGREIAVFFYDGPTSRAVAFEGLLNSGEIFGQRLANSLKPASATPEDDEPQLAHIATDGESYGHHHKHGEMALSYALFWIEEQGLGTLTNYGEFLEKFPPTREAEIVEESSWSCFHGVERWRSDCGCNGGKPGWHQRWRGPLRSALDLLRDRTAPLAEAVGKDLFKDLWAARDAYIQVVLDRRPQVVNAFLAEHATHALSASERTTALELMEMERHAQLMYTSCGWFFDEISGIETVQIIAYAGRVLQLCSQLFGETSGEQLEAAFLEILAQAPSNVPEHRDGAEIYRKWVRNQRVDLEHVGAHYAISSMFQTYPESGEIFCYDVHRGGYEVFTSGRGRIALGRASLRSRITEESEEICFAVLHLGDQNLSAAVRRFGATEVPRWQDFRESSAESIRAANLPGLVRGIDGFFGSTTYSLKSLFADEQRRILNLILDQTINEVEGSLMRIYEEHATLLDFLGTSRFPVPDALALTARFAINASLRRSLSAEVYDASEVTRLLRRAQLDNAVLDTGTLSWAADRCMKKAMLSLESVFSDQNAATLQETVLIAESLRTLPASVSLWQAQNIWHELLHRDDPAEWTREWREGFRRLGTALRIEVDGLLAGEGMQPL